MKAYDIKIELMYSEPKVWRRVRMPADATFTRLHQIIQTVTNFQSEYLDNPYHLFQFDLDAEDILVTNDEEAYEEYQHYKKNRKRVDKQLARLGKERAERERQRLSTVVRKPTRLKIDNYLETHGEIHYTYDFGDNWEFLITLEGVVEDYHFGYPTLLDGAGDAPPEDVGGVPGFQEFLRVYNDPEDPEHEEMLEWAESQKFWPYDPEHVDQCLKHIHYKKTEWDKLDHDNYQLK